MNKNKKEENAFRINHRIIAPQVRLVGDNVRIDIYKTSDAIRIAEDMGLDLVEISPTQNPPIAKIMDYKKFLYDRKKNEKKPDKMGLKEIRFRPVTDENDFNFKIKHAQNFLTKGDRLKVVVIFKGREITYTSQGAELLERFVAAVADCGTPEAVPKFEGKKMLMLFRPKKK